MEYIKNTKTPMHYLCEDIGNFLMVSNEYKYKNVRNNQLRDRQQRVNQIAHVPAKCKFGRRS